MRFLARAVLCGALLTSAGALSAAPATAAAPASTPVSGIVFGDANSSGTADAGEGLKAFTISFDGRNATAKTTTGPGGAFTTRLAPGSYYVSGSGGGWYLVGRIVDVSAAGLHLDLRAVHPLGKVLTASMRFTRASYKPREAVHLVVTVTNTGNRLLRGIGAECDAGGFPDELINTNAGWGPFEAFGRGVTLPAHSTRTVDVTDHVPPGAPGVGQVSADCTFGYDGVDTGHRALATARADVPGEKGSLVGVVSQSGTATVGLAGVRVVLVNSRSCPTLREAATTDAQGRFRFTGIPAGYSYLLYFAPPAGWRLRDQNPGTVQIPGNDTANVYVTVERGTAGVPTPPSACSVRTTSPSGAPTHSSSDVPLANTGVPSSHALELGLLLLVAGAGVTAASRRRRGSH